jgi:hypothetical protein
VGFSPNFSQEINTLKLIWAFKFSKSKVSATKKDKVYDLNDFVKVRLISHPSGSFEFVDQELTTQGILTGPSRFECEITPRSAQHAEVIKRELLSATQTFEPFEQQLDPADREFVTQLRRDLADEIHLL